MILREKTLNERRLETYTELRKIYREEFVAKRCRLADKMKKLIMKIETEDSYCRRDELKEILYDGLTNLNLTRDMLERAEKEIKEIERDIAKEKQE